MFQPKSPSAAPHEPKAPGHSPVLAAGAAVLALVATALYLFRILLPNLFAEGARPSDPWLLWACVPPCALIAVAVFWASNCAYRAIVARDQRPAGWCSVRPGGAWDRHAIALPALCFSVAWLPYVVIFFRRSIAFGDLGSPLPLGTWGYWVLLAFQLFVCVISHSLALRTIIRLYAPRWLIAGSVLFFCLSPMWGMLTAADVRHPLFAMMVCVLTSSVAFVVFSEHPKPWLWAELAGASLLVALLRSTGIWAVIATLVGLFLHKLWNWHRARRDLGRDTAPLRAELAASAAVLVAVCAAFALASTAGFGLPLGEPSYGSGEFSALVTEAGRAPFSDVSLSPEALVANDVPYGAIEDLSAFPGLASAASRAIFAQQELPVFGLLFSEPFYVLVFAFFLVLALARRDGRALLVGLPQLGILAVMVACPADATLRFLLPVMAAQIMFFGALMRGVEPIGGRSAREAALGSKAPRAEKGHPRPNT